MSNEIIKQFLEKIKSDPKAQELLLDVERPGNPADEIRVYADIAAQLGYDLTEDDLKSFLDITAACTAEKTESAAFQIEELPDDVLEKVAGGKKEHDNCKDTFRDYENCWINDGCDYVYHSYDDYVCHRHSWSDPCHETAKPCSNDAYCTSAPHYM